jgi:uncharacterized membrane protein YccC
MLTKPDRAAVKALTRLGALPDWAEFSKMLDKELEATHQHLVLSHDPVKLHQMQGRAQILQELQAAAREAPALLEKLRDSSL